MQRYLLRRLVLAIPVLVGVTLLAAGLIRLVPGDAVLVKLEEAGVFDPLLSQLQIAPSSAAAL